MYAYGLYLLHMPVRAFVREHVYGPASRSAPLHFPWVDGSEIFGQLLFYPVALAAIVPVAWLSYHLFEKHFLKLKRFFGDGSAPAPASVVPVAPAVAAPAPRG